MGTKEPMNLDYKSRKQWEGEGGWQPDSDNKCTVCNHKFSGLFGDKSRYHHCRWCGKLVHKGCSKERSVDGWSTSPPTKRMCNLCNEYLKTYWPKYTLFKKTKATHEAAVLKKAQANIELQKCEEIVKRLRSERDDISKYKRAMEKELDDIYKNGNIPKDKGGNMPDRRRLQDDVRATHAAFRRLLLR